MTKFETVLGFFILGICFAAILAMLAFLGSVNVYSIVQGMI